MTETMSTAAGRRQALDVCLRVDDRARGQATRDPAHERAGPARTTGAIERAVGRLHDRAAGEAQHRQGRQP